MSKDVDSYSKNQKDHDKLTFFQKVVYTLFPDLKKMADMIKQNHDYGNEGNEYMGVDNQVQQRDQQLSQDQLSSSDQQLKQPNNSEDFEEIGQRQNTKEEIGKPFVPKFLSENEKAFSKGILKLAIGAEFKDANKLSPIEKPVLVAVNPAPATTSSSNTKSTTKSSTKSSKK